MRIMGLHAWAHEVSWLLTGLATFSFIAVSVAALLSWTFLPLADGSLLLVFMLAFTLSEVGMAMAVASVFSKVCVGVCAREYLRTFLVSLNTSDERIVNALSQSLNRYIVRFPS